MELSTVHEKDRDFLTNITQTTPETMVEQTPEEFVTLWIKLFDDNWYIGINLFSLLILLTFSVLENDKTVFV